MVELMQATNAVIGGEGSSGGIIFPAVHLCRDFFGVDRIMHGTDHPFWPMPLGPRLLDQLDLSPGDREKIEHENAARVFRIQVPMPRGAV